MSVSGDTTNSRIKMTERPIKLDVRKLSIGVLLSTVDILPLAKRDAISVQAMSAVADVKKSPLIMAAPK